MTAQYRLQGFGSCAPPPVRELTRLHAELLPTSPVALLGDRFMESFYYRVLPRQGLIVGAVAYVDEQPAGFVAATHDRGFMRTALRTRWPRAAWAVGTSVVAAPKALGAVWQAWGMMRSRRRAEGGEREGEILTLGVLPAYRERNFIRHSGLRIATDLLDMAVGALRKMGIQQIGAVVRADNTEAKLFYVGLGWTLHRTSVPGVRTAAVEFALRGASGVAVNEATEGSSVPTGR
ncbi:MAG: GNAT family N-acetyltransferase [Gaiellales bacterium]